MGVKIAPTWIQPGAESTFSTSSLAARQETGSTSPPAREETKHKQRRYCRAMVTADRFDSNLMPDLWCIMLIAVEPCRCAK